MEPISDIQSSVETLVFEETDFVLNFETKNESDFDQILCRKWMEALDKNVFKYKVTQNYLKSKVIPGLYRMIAQLNEGRATMRRKPEDISSIQCHSMTKILISRELKPKKCCFASDRRMAASTPL